MPCPSIEAVVPAVICNSAQTPMQSFDVRGGNFVALEFTLDGAPQGALMPTLFLNDEEVFGQLSDCADAVTYVLNATSSVAVQVCATMRGAVQVPPSVAGSSNFPLTVRVANPDPVACTAVHGPTDVGVVDAPALTAVVPEIVCTDSGPAAAHQILKRLHWNEHSV